MVSVKRCEHCQSFEEDCGRKAAQSEEARSMCSRACACICDTFINLHWEARKNAVSIDT